MSSHTLVIPLLHRRRRAFFLASFTQQMRSAHVVPEVVRAASALLGLVAWVAMLVLLVG